jgi:CNT family concentrative nucleoside transporter
MAQVQSAVGALAILALAWAFSEARRHVDWRLTVVGTLITTALAAVLVAVPPVAQALGSLNAVVDGLAAATRAGTSFVFGYLGGGPTPFDVAHPDAAFVFAFQALPLVLVMSVLTTLLFHWGVLPPLVRGVSWALTRTLGVGGAVGVSTAANVLVGMVEAPLFIRPYLDRLTRAEMFMVMTGGMAGIAGTVMVLYATIVGPAVPGAFGHILAASLLGAPAALVIAGLMVPEREGRVTVGDLDPGERIADGTMDAIVRGTVEGLDLLLKIVAMLIVFVALVALVNLVLGALPDVEGAPLTLERMLGWVFTPLALAVGVPWAEAGTAGALLGAKTVLNELIAYVRMAELPNDALSPRSRLLMLYALCGFANAGSLGIMIGGLTAMAPGRRADIVALGPRTIVSGTLSTCLVAAIVGAFVAG